MDITIPSHKLKIFSSSISTLGKIGKDLYLSFDPMEGLTLSTLNDAKSAFCKFHFDSSFFERCTSCSGGGVSSDGGGGRLGTASSSEAEYDTRYVCRVPLRSFHSILRPNRKGVLSLRIRSEGVDRESGVYFGLNKKKSSNAAGSGAVSGRRRGRRGHQYQRRRGRGNHNNNHDDDSDGNDSNSNDDNDDSNSNSNSNSNSSDDEKNRSNSYSAKNGQSRKRRKNNNNAQTTPSDNTTTNDNNNNNNNNMPNMSNNSNSNQDKMMLSFEFFIERPPSKHTLSNNASDQRADRGGVRGAFRSLHKLAVTTTHGITLSASPKQRSTRSEIISHPKLWLRLLDPLRRTAEVALTIDDGLRVVTATTFHPGEMVGGGGGGNIGGAGGGREQETASATATAAGGGNNNNNGNGKREENAILLAAAARNAMLKTETSTGCDEFDEYDFRNNRGKKRRRRRNHCGGGSGGSDGSDGDDNGDGDGDCDDGSDTREFDFEREGDQPPMDVNQKVILVFSIKEAKAMLHFCSQTNNSAYHDDGDALSILSFHWGGRPIVIETDGDSYSAELVLATLHHAMIASDMTVGGSGGGNGNRRISGDGD